MVIEKWYKCSSLTAQLTFTPSSSKFKCGPPPPMSHVPTAHIATPYQQKQCLRGTARHWSRAVRLAHGLSAAPGSAACSSSKSARATGAKAASAGCSGATHAARAAAVARRFRRRGRPAARRRRRMAPPMVAEEIGAVGPAHEGPAATPMRSGEREQNSRCRMADSRSRALDRARAPLGSS